MLKLGYDEHSVITNRFLGQIGQFSAQINPVVTKPGYIEHKIAGLELFVKTEFHCSFKYFKFITMAVAYNNH